MRTVLTVLLSVAFVLSGLGLSVVAIEFVSVELGILTSPVQYPCPVNPKTSKWAANDWDTSIVVQLRNVNRSDRVVAEVTVPSGKVHRRTQTWSGDFARGCSYLFVPILGTDAEAWQGAWRASVLLNGKKVTEVSWEVTPPRPEALAEYQAYLAANPTSASAHYRVGAAAALAGQDTLGETELKEAARLGRTWLYPSLALGRLYHRQGKKELALEQFHFFKGLLLGRVVEEGSFRDYILAMTEDHLKQLEP